MAGNSPPGDHPPPHNQMTTARSVTYDFKPFLSCPAVMHVSRSYSNQLNIVSIPETKIPSPLARNLAPQTLLDLKEFLVGKPKANTRFGAIWQSEGDRRGTEVWESWKRAWDLWNNHFIEGRVDEVWVAQEYERITRGLKPRGTGTRRSAGSAGISSDGEGREVVLITSESDEGEGQQTTPIRSYRTWIGDNPANLPLAKIGRIWQSTGRKGKKPCKPSKKLKKKTGLKHKEMSSVFNRAVKVKAGDRVPIYGVKEKYADRKERNTELEFIDTGRTETIRKDGFHQSKENETYRDEEDVLVGEGDYSEEEWHEIDSSKFVTPRPQPRKRQPYPGLSVDASAGNPSASPRDRPSLRHTVRSSHLPSIPGAAGGSKSPQPRIIFGPVIGGDPDDVGSEDDRGISDILSADGDGDPEDGELKGTGDLSSGGFFAVKDLPEYKEPDFNADNADTHWDDVIRNSVWRPRRVGEKTLKIDLDEPIEEFFNNNNLERDGGVDCGRSPHPVLRSRIVYTRNSQGEFRKKKVWDGVTGTIFNMPNKPREPEPEAEDKKLERTQTIYGDYIRDNRYKWENPDIFPLDIRRVMRIDSTTGLPPPITPLVSNDEELIELPPECKQKPCRDMSHDDPWWVTEKERKARDVPSRRYPPRAHLEENSELLPVDDSIWKEQVGYDDNSDSKYFITNLHGATLLVNGMEVKKGCVAGPLPPFAVIECPGGQVAFWWGVGGRNWGEGPAGINFEAHWDTLRQKPGWRHVGLLAGQVWAMRVHDRKKRERTGEDQSDDETWERWKSAKKERDHDAHDPATGPPSTVRELIAWSGQGGTPAETFVNPADELKWLHLRAKKARQSTLNTANDELHDPVGNAFWTGSWGQEETPAAAIEMEFEKDWNQHQAEHFDTQHTFAQQQRNAKTLKEQEAKEQCVAAAEKRVAEGFDLPDPKKQKLEPDAAHAAKEKVMYERNAEDQQNRDLAAAAARLKKKQEIEAAVVASLLKGQPPHKHSLIRRNRAAAVKRQQASQDRILKELNVLRAKKGQPLIPPRNVADIDDHLASIKRTKGERAERDGVIREEEHRQQVEQEEIMRKHAPERRARREAAEKEQKRLDDLDTDKRRKVHEAGIKAVSEKRRQDLDSQLSAIRRQMAERFNQFQEESGVDRVSRQTTRWQNQFDLERALEMSRNDQDARDQQQLEEAIKQSMTLEQQKIIHERAMEARAQVARQTVQDYIRSQGFNSVMDYVHAQISLPSKVSDDATIQVLKSSQRAFRDALMDGLKARAHLEGKTARGSLEEKGWDKISDWIGMQAAAITVDDIPGPVPQWPRLPNNRLPTPAERSAYEEEKERIRTQKYAVADENRRRWVSLCDRITEAADWDAIIRRLPDPKHPPEGTWGGNPPGWNLEI